MNELIENRFTSYEAYKQELGIEIRKTTESFVKIGYLLKVARDTDVLSTSEYSNYLDFAAGEYGFDKSTVSRFIGINDRFSVGGNSADLLPQYAGYGRAQLQEMLLLPESITEELSPDLTRQEIADIKKEYQEEQSITDIEVLLEPKQDEELTITEKIIKELIKPEYIYEKLYRALKLGESIRLILMPHEDDSWTLRVSGAGKYLVHIKPEGAKAVNMRTNEKEDIDWATITDFVMRNVDIEAPSYRESYLANIGDLAEVAPVQQPQKESRVHTQKPENDKKGSKTQKNEEKSQKSEEKSQKCEEIEQKSTEDVREVEADVHEIEEPKADDSTSAPPDDFMPLPEEPEIVEANQKTVVEMPESDLQLLEYAQEAATQISNVLYTKIEVIKNNWSNFEERRKASRNTIELCLEYLTQYVEEIKRREL